MRTIQVLDKHVAELIAAGEVVERPASVIKELVENSIDAGATAITVEIQQGGVTYMRVTDNGCGIAKDEVCTALLRHATSKVQSVADLDAIGSLGFRGEALASIAAVSHLALLTREPQAQTGTRLLAHGGDVESVEEAGCPVGTSLTIRDIFYNVPARMKFLKKDIGEGNAVAGVMDKIALSHPEISLRLIRDKKQVLHTPGDNQLSSAVYAVHGKDFLAGMLPVSYSLLGMRIWGFVSKPAAARPTRAMQSLFINGRYVRSRTAMAALEEAFKGSLMAQKFPACVLHITMECGLLDVNVHPAKLEVRFTNERPIFDLVYHGVKSALNAGDGPKEMPLTPKRPPVNPYAQAQAPKQQVLQEKPIVQPKEEPIFQKKGEPLQDAKSSARCFEQTVSAIEAILEAPVVPHAPPLPTALQAVAGCEAQEPSPPPLPHRVIGEAFHTYIIVEMPDCLLLVDKHAAHERLLYQRLRQEGAGNEAQGLLPPVTVALDQQGYGAILAHLPQLDQAGFAIEDFGGGTVLVRSAPLSLDQQDATLAVMEIAERLCQTRGQITTDHMDWLYHNIACRAAIKGGQKTSEQECIALARELWANPAVRYCPHGRPVFVEIKRREIEKNFGRV